MLEFFPLSLDAVQKLSEDEQAEFVVGMVGHMSVGNMTKLVQTIEKKFDVTATNDGPALPQVGQHKRLIEEIEKTELTVLLKAADPSKKILLIKEVRAITGLGLKEAKDLVDGAPRPVKSGVPKADAEAAKKRLEDAGGTVELT